MSGSPAPTLSFDEPMSPSRIFFSFDGRIARGTWWLYGVGAMCGLGLLGTVLLRVAGLGAEAAASVVNLLLLWPALAVSVKRWHDRDKPAWWVLVTLVPVIGWIWMVIENGLLRGTAGPNRFGEDPAAGR